MKNGDWRINISPSLRREGRIATYERIRLQALTSIGDKCVRCGFSDERALHIDHVAGKGNEERRSKKGASYYYFIFNEVQAGRGNKYQVLCANCNYIKRKENQECPLKKDALTK